MKKVLLVFVVLLSSLIGMGQTVSIGDILCTDGSTISAAEFLSSGKTAEGVVFYVDNNGQQGWAVNLHIDALDIDWVHESHYYDGFDIPDLPNSHYSRDNIFDLDGYQNTAIIRAAHGADWFPAAWSVDFDHGWYLPAAGQLRWLIAYANEINESLTIVNGTPFVHGQPNWYWSSTEQDAMHAILVAENGSTANYMKWNYYHTVTIGVRSIRNFSIAKRESHLIGDVVVTEGGQKGIVFYVSPEDDTYWLVALDDLPEKYQWGDDLDIANLDNYPDERYVLHSIHCGYDATAAMLDVQGTNPQYAVSHVDLADGWHIPSSGQLSKLFAALPHIEAQLIANGGHSPSGDYYWTSTECNSNEAWTVNLGGNPYQEGALRSMDKATQYSIRPVWSQSCETINLPTVGSIVTPEAICTNESLTLQIPESQFANAQGWQMSPTMDFNSPIPYSGEPLDTSYNGWYLRYYAANEAGTIYSNVVNITIWPNHETSFNIMACTHYVWNGIDYDESGDYEQHLFSIHGCDSIVTMHLTIANVVTNEWAYHTCEDSFAWNGITYYETGDYEQTFSTSENCDSIVTLHLTLSEALEVDTDSVACGSLWWNGQEYTESGHYEQQFVTVDGCDSLVRMNLTVLPFPKSIPEIIGLQEVYVSTDIVLGKYHYSIDSVEFATHYEWILEDADWTMDTTGTHCTLWVTTPGTATLKVRAWNDCGYTEQEIVINAGFFDVDDNQVLPITVYPNPAQDKVFIEAEGIVHVRLFDLLGQCLIEMEGGSNNLWEISTNNLSTGIYTIEIQTESGKAIRKLEITR